MSAELAASPAARVATVSRQPLTPAPDTRASLTTTPCPPSTAGSRRPRPRPRGRWSEVGRAARTSAPIAVIGLLLSYVGTDGVAGALRSLTATDVALALACGTVASAARWCVVARGVGVDVGLGEAIREVYRSTLLNSVLPAGVLGDLHRALAQRPRRGNRGVIAVAVERGIGQVVIATAAIAVASPVLMATTQVGVSTTGALVTAGSSLAAVTTAVMVVRHHRTRLVAALAKSMTQLRGAVLNPRSGPAVAALSLLAFGGYMALFCPAARAAGVHTPIADLAPLLAISLLATAVPINIGGWGPREAVSTAAFAAAGIGPAAGLTVAVLYGVLSLISVLPGAVLLLSRRPSNYPPRRHPSKRQRLEVFVARWASACARLLAAAAESGDDRPEHVQRLATDLLLCALPLGRRLHGVSRR